VSYFYRGELVNRPVANERSSLAEDSEEFQRSTRHSLTRVQEILDPDRAED